MKRIEELVDLVDRQGQIIKTAIPRSVVDDYPNLHMPIVIVAVFNDQGEILVHQRAKNKKTHPGYIDLAAGAIMSGEDPEQAAIRELEEETGVLVNELNIVSNKVNVYNRFCYLFRGLSNQPPKAKTHEAIWVKYLPIEQLRSDQISGKLKFVDDFFEDIEQARVGI